MFLCATVCAGLPGLQAEAAFAKKASASANELALAAEVIRRMRPEPPKPPRPREFFPIAGKADYGTETNLFGNDRGGHIHEGQDVFAAAGTKLVAVRDGVVLEAGTDGGRGNYAYVYSEEANETYGYFHMQSAPAVRAGQKVRGGERLGELGCTGSCSGDHLHFEVHRGKDAYENAVDPLPLLKRLD